MAFSASNRIGCCRTGAGGLRSPNSRAPLLSMYSMSKLTLAEYDGEGRATESVYKRTDLRV